MAGRRNNRERPLTRQFWKKHGGTLIEEFPAVPRRGKGYEGRKIDGVIVYGEGCQLIEEKDALVVNGERIRGQKGNQPCRVRIKGKRIVVIQTKPSPISMSLLGQTLFSGHLMEKFEPESIDLVALCTKGDIVLEELAKRYNIKVEKMEKSHEQE